MSERPHQVCSSHPPQHPIIVGGEETDDTEIGIRSISAVFTQKEFKDPVGGATLEPSLRARRPRRTSEQSSTSNVTGEERLEAARAGFTKSISTRFLLDGLPRWPHHFLRTCVPTDENRSQGNGHEANTDPSSMLNRPSCQLDSFATASKLP